LRGRRRSRSGRRIMSENLVSGDAAEDIRVELFFLVQFHHHDNKVIKIDAMPKIVRIDAMKFGGRRPQNGSLNAPVES
jgi:hypothetical protein